MSTGLDLEELLLRWEESRERGEEITVEELCREHPEQIAKVRRLVRMLEDVNALISDQGDASTEVDTSARLDGSLPGELVTSGRMPPRTRSPFARD